jgi:hypothetical protein
MNVGFSEVSMQQSITRERRLWAGNDPDLPGVFCDATKWRFEPN